MNVNPRNVLVGCVTAVLIAFALVALVWAADQRATDASVRIGIAKTKACVHAVSVDACLDRIDQG
jgi:hypothetical protein